MAATRWLDVPTKPDLRTLHAWWSACNGGTSLGMTPEFVLKIVRPFRTQILVTDVIGDRLDYRSSVVGSQWMEMIGRDITNGLLSRFENPLVQSKCRLLFNRVIEQRSPVVINTPLAFAPRHSAEMMFLPLAAAKGEITHFITALPRAEIASAKRKHEVETRLVSSAQMSQGARSPKNR